MSLHAARQQCRQGDFNVRNIAIIKRHQNIRTFLDLIQNRRKEFFTNPNTFFSRPKIATRMANPVKIRKYPHTPAIKKKKKKKKKETHLTD